MKRRRYGYARVAALGARGDAKVARGALSGVVAGLQTSLSKNEGGWTEEHTLQTPAEQVLPTTQGPLPLPKQG